MRWRVSAPGVAGAALLLLVCGRTPAWAQQTVGGIVVDAGTSQPLAGAQVVIEATGQGTITGTNGRFLLADVTGAEVELRVVLIGYRDGRARRRRG